MKILDTKKLITGILAVNMAAGLSSCAYVDDYIDSMLETESTSSTQSKSAQDSSLPADESKDESTAESEYTEEESVADESAADTSSDSEVQSQSPMDSGAEEDSSAALPDSGVSLNSGVRTDSSADEITDSNVGEDNSSSSSVVTPALNTIYDSYAEIIYNYSEKCAGDSTYLPEYCGYLIADIDLNGTPELLIETGTCDIDRAVEVYTYDGKDAQLAGSFSLWHSDMGFMDNKLYTETSAMGAYTLYLITIDDGEVVREKVDTAEESRLTEKAAFYSFDNFNSTDSSQIL